MNIVLWSFVTMVLWLLHGYGGFQLARIIWQKWLEPRLLRKQRALQIAMFPEIYRVTERPVMDYDEPQPSTPAPPLGLVWFEWVDGVRKEHRL